MGFGTYDLTLLVLFIIFTIVFLVTRKKNLERQGIIYLYKTKFGIKFIDVFAKRFEKILKPAQYVVLASGYALMIAIVWLFAKSAYLYLRFPIAQVIKTPPIVPLIPYFPKLFGLDSFLPPFYFTYFIIALAVVAIVHEFSHGIFARLHKFKIHSTGFAFLGPILGAFVEPDEKQMQKAKKFPQMVILAAGTFANVITTILFVLILGLFFTALFVPVGIKFNDYSSSIVAVESISVIGNSSIEGFLEIDVDGERYFVSGEILQLAETNSVSELLVYDDTPAFTAELKGSITEINGEKITSMETLTGALESYSPGDKINVKTAVFENGRDKKPETKNYEIELSERDGAAFLGIGFRPLGSNGVIGAFYSSYSLIKDPFIYYESSLGDVGWFIYYLLWWIVVINLLVALFNMLPLGILDGGRFFYLTIWGLTGSERFGKKSYKFMTWFILLLLLAIMVKWVMRFF